MGTAEVGAVLVLTEKSVKGLLETRGRFWGRFIWGSVNCRGGDCSPGSGWLGNPPCAAWVEGSRPGPGSPASVYTSMGESEGSAAPQPAAPASILSCTEPGLSSSWYMAARSSHLFSATLARTAAAL